MKKKKICIFSGTTEGHKMADYLKGENCLVHVCVATEYGQMLQGNGDNITVHTGRMDVREMLEFFAAQKFDLVVNAAHPYAQDASKNIKEACESAGLKYLRLWRGSEKKAEGVKYFSGIDGAADYLNGTEGNIFLATGSKEIKEFTKIDGFKTRAYARVLFCGESIAECLRCGLQQSNIIAMQGPFPEDLNAALFRFTGAKYLVTKDSGAAGGFAEKVRAALECGMEVLVIGRPTEEEGASFGEAVRQISLLVGIKKSPQIDIVGVGPGGEGCLTFGAKEIIKNADCVVGSGRALEAAKGACGELFAEYKAEKIKGIVDANPHFSKIAVLVTGDAGFYSAAKNVAEVFSGCSVNVTPGISSVVYFAAKLKTSWEDAGLVSLHAREGNVLYEIQTREKVFALLGGGYGAKRLAETLAKYGFGDLKMTIGERLSYGDEKITSGTANELMRRDFDGLSVAFIENPCPRQVFNISDEELERNETPMTKSEIREIALSKLGIEPQSVVYDIGAGTGSVSVEAALTARNGKVYAVEFDKKAIEVLQKNKIKFKTANLEIVEGAAPEALTALPAPTHVFIGGSSGNIRGIIAAVLEKNSYARVAANAVTLETTAELAECAKEFGFDVSETVQVNISKAKKMGNHRLMAAQNPVFIFIMQKSVGGEK